MTIAVEGFFRSLNEYFEAHPESIEDGRVAQAALSTLAGRTFASEGELVGEVKFIMDTFFRGNPGLANIMQRLFNREIRRLYPAPSASRERCPKRRQDEMEGASSSDRERLVSRGWDREQQAVRASYVRQLRGPELQGLLQNFGIMIPPHDASPIELSTAYSSISARMENIWQGVISVLDDGEKEVFRLLNPREVQDPRCFRTILQAGLDSSLVHLFGDGWNDGPDLSGKKTLAEKAQAIRNHIQERGDSYTRLQRSHTLMCCFPIEICSLKNLQDLELSDCFLAFIPPEIERLQQLQTLVLNGNDLRAVPSAIMRLRELRILNLSRNQLTVLPDGTWDLPHLQIFNLSYNGLVGHLPGEIQSLPRQMNLNVSFNPHLDPRDLSELRRQYSITADVPGFSGASLYHRLPYEREPSL